jgi:hypothetical protein
LDFGFQSFYRISCLKEGHIMEIITRKYKYRHRRGRVMYRGSAMVLSVYRLYLSTKRPWDDHYCARIKCSAQPQESRTTERINFHCPYQFRSNKTSFIAFVS